MTVAALRDSYDVAVIGAGPAGLAAAALAARAGLAAVLFDEQMSPGGQIYRAVAEAPPERAGILGEDYRRGARLADDLRASGADYVPGATVWSVSREREIGVSIAGAARIVGARRIVLATGAIERPFPVPGWTLPGVMTAGAAQILLKSSGLVAQGRTVLAGCGPLLWLLAWQYLRAGKKLDAILDTTPRENRTRAARHLPEFLTSGYALKGLRLLAAVRLMVPVVTGVLDLAIEGEGRAEAVTCRTARGTTRLPADTVLLHHGVVPNVNLAMSVGVEHRWDETQLCWTPVVDESGATSIEGLAIAGDGAGIGGAQAAEERGRLAALAAVRALRPGAPGLPDEAACRRRLRAHERGRRFLDVLYAPADRFRRPADDVIVCRCEEVTAREIRDTVALGCLGPNQLKSFTRCGMGPCQGRMCGPVVTEIIAEARGVSPAEVGYYRLRPPVKPITLAELAGLPKTDAALKAVVRS